MADPELVERLRQGSAVWNAWQKQHPLGQRFDLSGAERGTADLSGANLSGAYLSAANLSGADLRGADLSRADLSGAGLSGVNLSGANLFNAYLINADLSGTDLRGVDLHYANLSRANLSRAKLRHADLSHADLSHANLSGAYLRHADLSHADLSHADLSGADLSGAYLRDADLSDADLSSADLSDADLSSVNLSDADLSHSKMWNTVFVNVDLCKTKGLVEVIHQGPSIVQLHTVQFPQDGSALHFLRGTGIPDAWIVLYRAEMMHPIQYHSLFISYSSKDETLARRLHADLQVQGVRCWFAPEDMKIGDKIRVRIDEAIHLQDKLLLLLSEHALASAWVEDEVDAALEKEQQQKREVLFPVRLDASVMQTTQAWAAKLRRSRHIGDFTHWTNPQAYQQAFERLLRDLKAGS